MKLNETRLAVAADLAKKLEKLHSAARIACSSLECRKMTFQQVKDDPGKAALRIRNRRRQDPERIRQEMRGGAKP